MHSVKITKIDGVETTFFVAVKLANGYTTGMRCPSEEQARVYVRGLQDGFVLAKNAVDIGLHFNGTIEQG